MSKRTRTSHKRKQKQESIVVWIIAGIAVLFMLAVTNWTVFLCCAGVLIALIVITFTVKISRHARLHAPHVQPLPGVTQGEIVRDSRYITASTKRKVWERDGGQCVECHSRSLLEYDHVIPYSKGGATSTGNLQLLCRTCNRHKSDKI